jgi:aspartate carbamoyltransferase catalytic subunit
MKHILTADQFTPKELASLFEKTDSLRRLSDGTGTRKELASRHTDKQICSLFYEPSTRTRTSFEAAALKLNEYDFAAVVIRHPQTGAVAEAAAVSQVPIINAGDGKGDHPTQSLLDIYTIYRHFGRLDNLRVVMGGDLLNGRTVRSLAKLLSKYPNNRLVFVSLPELQMAADVKEILRASNTAFEETETMEAALAGADVVYWTRLQKERLESSSSLASGGFVIDAKALQILPKQAIIMHPLPRVDEIAVEVDSDPRAKYFEQAGNGLYIRMALLDQIVSTI